VATHARWSEVFGVGSGEARRPEARPDAAEAGERLVPARIAAKVSGEVDHLKDVAGHTILV
jgi:hypothetical protein